MTSAYNSKPQPTPIDELHALLEDYRGEDVCSCPESALLRWIIRRIRDVQGPDDTGLALTALDRMDRIDRERAGETVLDEANPLGAPANEDERAPRAIRTMTPEEEAAWAAEASLPKGRHAYEALYDRMEPGRSYFLSELVALAGGDGIAAKSLIEWTRLVRRVPTYTPGISAYVRDAP